MDEFRLVFEDSGVDIICVSETWFDPIILDSIFDLDKFRLFRCDRRSHAGGVAIYVRNGIPCRKCFNSEQGDQIEFIFVEISSVHEKILLGCVYRPNRSISTDHFLGQLENMTLRYEEIVICGDFNSDLLSDSQLVNDMIAFGLSPTNTSIPTHYTNTRDTLIDIIFVSNREKVLLYDQLSAPCFSKHDLLFISLNFQRNTCQNVVQYFDFKNLNYELLYCGMRQTNWNSIYFMPSVDEQVDFFQNNLSNIFHNCVPIRTVSIDRKRKPWFDNDIKCAIEKRDLVYKRWKRFKNEELLREYCLARKIVNRKIKRAKSLYYSSVFTSAILAKLMQ